MTRCKPNYSVEAGPSRKVLSKKKGLASCERGQYHWWERGVKKIIVRGLPGCRDSVPLAGRPLAGGASLPKARSEKRGRRVERPYHEVGTGVVKVGMLSFAYPNGETLAFMPLRSDQESSKTSGSLFAIAFFDGFPFRLWKFFEELINVLLVGNRLLHDDVNQAKQPGCGGAVVFQVNSTGMNGLIPNHTYGVQRLLNTCSQSFLDQIWQYHC